MKEILLKQSSWKKLFQKAEFFNKYEHFIVINISAKDEIRFDSW